MILCLEGPSAVGKTTTCRLLSERLGAVIVPEVNALFERPPSAPVNWYLECQAERWNIARQASETHSLTVLDGDPFQPLWYNWSFGFQGLQSLNALNVFFRPLVASGTIGFPDRYVHLVVGEAELRQRKEADATRGRRNFDSHLRLIETQQRYFAAMEALSPASVVTVEAVSVESNLQSIASILQTQQDEIADSLAVFDGLVDWLESHRAEDEA